jgi:hypothetical protein
MTSEAKIAANRRNAQRSTGPRAAPAKARVRRNALRHGLAALVVEDPAVSAEVGRVAAGICGAETDPLDREQVMIVAEAQVTLKRIRKARTEIMEQMSPALPTRHSDGLDLPRMWEVEEGALQHVDRLLMMDRYERRALSRRKRAVRLLRL